jgi:hypothetical protein
MDVARRHCQKDGRRSGSLLAGRDEQAKIRQPVPLFPLIARGDPARGDDVGPVPAEPAQRRDLLFERGIDLCHETVRLWWNRIGPLFAADIRRQRVNRMRGFRQWKWHLDEMYVKLNGEMVYLWRAVDHEGEILESSVTKNGTNPRLWRS